MTYDLNEAQEEQPSLSLEEMEKMWGAETDLLQRNGMNEDFSYTYAQILGGIFNTHKVNGVYVKVCVTQDGVFVVQPSQILRNTTRRFLSSR